MLAETTTKLIGIFLAYSHGATYHTFPSSFTLIRQLTDEGYGETAEIKSCLFLICYELFFLVSRELFNRRFAFESLTSVFGCFRVYQCDRTFGYGVAGAATHFPVMFPDSARNIGRDSRIECVIGTEDDVDIPIHKFVSAQRFQP